jgi:hypothetical protein
MEDTEIKGRKLCVIFPNKKQNMEHHRADDFHEKTKHAARRADAFHEKNKSDSEPLKS